MDHRKRLSGVADDIFVMIAAAPASGGPRLRWRRRDDLVARVAAQAALYEWNYRPQSAPGGWRSRADCGQAGGAALVM